MSVQLVSIPDSFALTKGGRMLYQFSGAGRYQTTGVNAVGVLFLAAALPEGTKLDIRWNGQTVTLTFVSAPKGPNEFLAGDGSAVHLGLLLLQFQSHYRFKKDFLMSRYDVTQLPGIVFTAKKPGKAYDLVPTLVANTPFAFGNTKFGADPILREQYSIYVELWLQKLGTTGEDFEQDYEPVFSPLLECDADGNAEFDAGGVLHAQLTPDFPDWTTHQPVAAHRSIRKYFIWYAEAYGSPIEIGHMSRDYVHYALLGGMDYRRRASGGTHFYNWDAAVGEDQALRLGPSVRYVRPDEPQYLAFFNPRSDLGEVTLKISRTYDDDSIVVDAFAPGLPFLLGDKLLFSVGPTQRNLMASSPAGKMLKEYSVQLVNGDGTPRAIAYRYVLNYDYQPYTRYFVYLNSLGAPDTLTTFGKGSRELSRLFEQAARYLPAQYELADGQFVDYDISLQQTLELTTGFRSRAELKAWDDFYRSRDRFHLKAVGSQPALPLPVSLTSKSIKQYKDGDTLYAHSFQIQYLYLDAFYSADEDDAVNTLPPVGFMPAGSVSVQPVQIVLSVDHTVPDVVRDLSPARVAAWDAAAARPNPQTLGFLDQSAGNELYRPKDSKVPFTDLAGVPTTRDGLGLKDVPTKAEVQTGTSAGLRKAATDVDDSVTQAEQVLVYQTVTIDGKDYKQSAPMSFTTVFSFLLANATAEQKTQLRNLIALSLDDVLSNGNESNREEIIKASQRKTLQLEDTLQVISGRIWDSVRRLYVEREITISNLAKSLLATPEFVAALANGNPTNPTTGTAPAASDWQFGLLLTCEDPFKELGDDISNSDFQ